MQQVLHMRRTQAQALTSSELAPPSVLPTLCGQRFLTASTQGALPYHNGRRVNPGNNCRFLEAAQGRTVGPATACIKPSNNMRRDGTGTSKWFLSRLCLLNIDPSILVI